MILSFIMKLLKFVLLGFISLFVLFVGCYKLESINLTPWFLDTKEEIQWAKEMNSKVIDFYDQPWSDNETIEVPGNAESEHGKYYSPAQRYKFIYKPDNEGEGFYIVDVKSGKIALEAKQWVLHPSYVKWLFNEKYIIFIYNQDDMLGLQKHNVYLGSLKTGEITRLTTAESWDDPRMKRLHYEAP